MLGGAGVAPLSGGGPRVCELRKMYFLPELRGQEIGRELILRCIDFARSQNYQQMYLETLKSMTQAQALYEKKGFLRLDSPLGQTGHFSCYVWYLCDLCEL